MTLFSSHSQSPFPRPMEWEDDSPERRAEAADLTTRCLRKGQLYFIHEVGRQWIEYSTRGY